MNELNDRIFQRLSIREFNGGRVPPAPMFVTAGEFDPPPTASDSSRTLRPARASPRRRGCR